MPSTLNGFYFEKGSCSVALADLESLCRPASEPPASVSQMLGLQMYSTVPSPNEHINSAFLNGLEIECNNLHEVVYSGDLILPPKDSVWSQDTAGNRPDNSYK